MKTFTCIALFCLFASISASFDFKVANNEGCSFSYANSPMTQEQCITTCTQLGAPGWCYVSTYSCCMCKYDCPCSTCLCPFCGRENFIEEGQCGLEDLDGFLAN